MNIKSIYKDFYDYALSGIVEPDKEITFFRNIRREENKFYNLSSIQNGTVKYEKGIYKGYFYVFFCGKLYKGIESYTESNYSNKNYEYLEDFVLSEKEKQLLKYLESFEEPIVIVKSISNIDVVGPELNYSWKDSLKERERKEKHRKSLIKLVIKDYFSKNKYLLINDSLSLVNFYNIKSNYEVYQEIEMFLNKKNAVEKEVIFNDKEKIIQHGFDNMSFKKRKSNN